MFRTLSQKLQFSSDGKTMHIGSLSKTTFCQTRILVIVSEIIGKKKETGFYIFNQCSHKRNILLSIQELSVYALLSKFHVSLFSFQSMPLCNFSGNRVSAPHSPPPPPPDLRVPICLRLRRILCRILCRIFHRPAIRILLTAVEVEQWSMIPIIP